MALIDKTSIGTGNTIQAEHITRIIDALNESGSYEIIATGSFTGSFTGDGSGLTGVTATSTPSATSASYAVTASHALYAVSASYEINYETSSSYADFAKTASYVEMGTSGNNISESGGVTTHYSFKDLYITIGAGAGDGQFQFQNNGVASYYNLDSGDKFVIEPTTSRIIYDSTYLGQLFFDNGTLTSNRNWYLPNESGTIALTTDTLATASYALTASYVELAQTASYVTTSQTASYINATNIDGVVSASTTASYALTSSYIELAQTASYISGANVNGTVALATTASYAIGAKQLIGTSRTVYTFTTTDATPNVVGLLTGPIRYGRYIKAIVIGNASGGGGSLGGEFTKFYDRDTFGSGTTQLSSTGTLSDNMTGTPAFSISDIAEFTATGIAATTIDWRVIIEYSDI